MHINCFYPRFMILLLLYESLVICTYLYINIDVYRILHIKCIFCNTDKDRNCAYVKVFIRSDGHNFKIIIHDLQWPLRQDLSRLDLRWKRFIYKHESDLPWPVMSKKIFYRVLVKLYINKIHRFEKSTLNKSTLFSQWLWKKKILFPLTLKL